MSITGTLSRGIVLGCFALFTVSARADWPQWRGTLAWGSVAEGSYPERLDASTERWQVELPDRGCSTPILSGGRIVLTAPVEGRDALLSFDTSGKELWRLVFGPETPGKHRNGSGCNASPVTDGRFVFAYFKSGTFVGATIDGKVLWRTNLIDRFGEDKRFWDHGTSPVVTDKYVVMTRMHAGDSWLAAFDKQSGRLTWFAERNYDVPTENDQCYTTPLVIEHGGRQTILVWGAEHLTLHDAGDGKVIWSCGNFNPDGRQMWPAIATPVVIEDMIVVCYGRNDRGDPRLHGIRLKGEGDTTAVNHVWQRDDVGTFVPSPVAYRGNVYLVRDRGEVECIDPKTGESHWRERLPRGRANYYASPMIANGLLYAPREDGTVFVARVSDRSFELLSENDLEEPIIASPVPDQGTVLLRGERHIMRFGDANGADTP